MFFVKFITKYQFDPSQMEESSVHVSSPPQEKEPSAMDLLMAALKSQKASADFTAATDAIVGVSDETDPSRKRGASTEADNSLIRGPRRSRRLEISSSGEEAFKPSWGIRNMDSILGNDHLAVKWSLGSMTPTDRKNVIDGGSLEVTRRAGSQALAAANAYFQAALHEADSLGEELDAKKQKIALLEAEVRTLEENLQKAETEAYGARKKSEELEAKLQMVVPTFLKSAAHMSRLHAYAQSRVPETYTACFTHMLDEITRVAPDFNTSVLKNPFATVPSVTLPSTDTLGPSDSVSPSTPTPSLTRATFIHNPELDNDLNFLVLGPEQGDGDSVH